MLPPVDFQATVENDVLLVTTTNDAQADQVWLERDAWLRRFPATTLRLEWVDPSDGRAVVQEFSPPAAAALVPVAAR